MTIIVTIGLLGASAGFFLGLFEAACLRFTDLPLALNTAHVPPSFWFFAPLLAALTFSLLGLLAGVATSLARSRLLGMVIIAGFAGLASSYLALVLRYSESVSGWYLALGHYLTPAVLFVLVFAWTLPALWATRKPDSPLGFLADVPLRPWSGIVVALVATLLIAVGITHAPAPLSSTAAHTRSTAAAPNIVLILWDTTRADHLSSYGYFRNTTPNVDHFAKHGVLFENAISASSWTLPATASIFTSLLPHQHGASSDPGLGNGPRTLAEILRSGGYETAGFNANPYYGVVPWGLARGFETYVDSSNLLGYSLDATRIGNEFIEPFTQKWFHRHRFNQYNAHDLNEQVYHWYGHHSDRPFFLFLNYNDAHEPYEVPSPYGDHYGHASEGARQLLRSATLSRFYLPEGEREGVIAAYDNCLNYIDGQLGELLGFLERSPEWSNTYAIITADHGESFGEHDTYTHGWNLYREVLHVPLIIAGPGIPQGVRVKNIATTRQIFSTVLEMAGLKSPILRRTSLSRLWEPGYVPDATEAPISEMTDPTALPAPQGLISITTQEWQFIYRPGHRRSSLYHWPTDPLEQHNVEDLTENQAAVEQLKASLLSMVKGSYRPWRETRYLLAFSPSDYPPDLSVLESPPTPLGGPFLPHGAGAEQTLFAPNRETPQPNSRRPDQDLLESLPYDAR